MSYFSKFLRGTSQAPSKPQVDHLEEFLKAWEVVKDTLEYPDERQLARGIGSTSVPEKLKSMVDTLVAESGKAETGETGECLEYLLKNDVLGTLVRLSETDRPRGAQAEVLRAVQNMIVMLDEQFLVHTAVHKAVLRLLRTCVGDDIQEQLDGRNRPMGAAGSSTRAPPSEHEEDLVHLLCILCSRILTYRELLMIFFHDKHWYRSEPLFAVEEEDEDFEEEEGEPVVTSFADEDDPRAPSPTLSQATITGARSSPPPKKPEYEFLLFNYLLRFVHREGQIGEFARAGLLFLMDVAMSTAGLATPGHGADSPGGDPITDAALALAEYILDGDFSDVLGAGLVAVYSTLPRKLGFSSPIPEGDSAAAAMVIGNSGLETEDAKEHALAMRDRNRALGIDDASDVDFKARLDHFLKQLEFLQDVLRKNVESDGTEASQLIGGQIVQAILDAARRVFLENAFYSSILECSDTDGSSVAVMSYIDIMVRTLRPGPLVDLLVEFLTEEGTDDSKLRRPSSLPKGPPQASAPADRATKLKRRKSSAMVFLEMEAPDSRRKSEYFIPTSRFTLRDLLLANLKSKNQASATIALQLLGTMLTYQPYVTAERVLVVIPDSRATAFPHPLLIGGPEKFESSFSADEEEEEEFRYPGTEEILPSRSVGSVYVQPAATMSTHEREMSLYLSLITRVDPSSTTEGFSTGYTYYLHDALLAIQAQPSYWSCSELPFNSKEVDKQKHRLNANDPVLSRLLESARSFFSNTPDFNVGLTGVFATLALNPHRSLAGWLTFAHNDNLFGSPDRVDIIQEDDDKSIDFRIDEKLATDTNVLPAARMDEHSRPVVHTVLQSLVNQLERYRQQVADFDKYLSERRQGLLFSENLTDALQISLDDEPAAAIKPIPVETPVKPKRPSATSAIASFLTPRKSRSKPTQEPTTPERSPPKGTPRPSPFGSHYQQTSSITVEPVIAPVPFTALWTPSKKQSWDAMEEDVFGSAWADRSDRSLGSSTSFDDEEEVEEEVYKPQTVTLSQLLDNVVILEESIKELVAIIHARRSLGIDAIRYL